MPAGNALRGRTAAMPGPSMTTALSWCRRTPSKRVPVATAWLAVIARPRAANGQWPMANGQRAVHRSLFATRHSPFAKRSSRARDLLQVAGAVNVGAEPLSEADEHGVEALDQAHRVGLGMLGGEC